VRPLAPREPIDEQALVAEQAAVGALAARGRYGIRLGLGRTRALLRALGSPDRGLRGALIGGTNGKGSTQALVASVLSAAGRRVGQTPSPHLVSYRERIVVAGQPIGIGDFTGLVAEVIETADRLPRRLGPPTEFEVLTAAAFLWFARSGVDVAVVEVGIGGRLDATNAWDGGVAAITGVGIDHTEQLGPTIEAIAREKAAIIKRGDRAVTGAVGAALAVVRRRARRMSAPLQEVAPLAVNGMDRGGLHLEHPVHGPFRLGLLGRHQAGNAAVAVGIVEALDASGIARLDLDALRRGLAAARWPGRLELLRLGPDGRARPASPHAPVPGEPDVLLDGAHNADGALALATAFQELRPGLSRGRPTVLVGILRDKEVTRMVEALASSPALRGARVVATTVPSSARALAADGLAAAWPGPASAVEDAAAALTIASEHALAADGPLLVCGSLYLVGAVRARLLGSGEPAT
jgi:dihydrofolate synthase/folylpolyglutamate synthase